MSSTPLPDLDSTRLFGAPSWQMTYGERAALEGLVSQLRPRLAVEIGTAEGGSLACIAAHSEQVHSLDLVEPQIEIPANVSVHTGDSRKLLPALLATLAAEGRNVDFALVDGDHSAEGVRADLLDLVGAEALQRTLIAIHDTMNDIVREGIRGAALEQRPGVVYADLDFVPGFLTRRGPFAGQLWGGLGIVLVDRQGGHWREGVHEDLRYDPHPMLRVGERGMMGVRLARAAAARLRGR